MRKVYLVSLVLVLALGFVGVAQAGSAYVIGDVFLGTPSGTVIEYTPTGTLVQTLSTGQAGYITGMAFDSAGNLYTTDFAAGDISKFDNSGNLVNSIYITGLAAPESIAVDAAGNQYITQVGGTTINKYSPTGTLLSITTAGQSIWNDLAGDQHTMLYTDQGTTIHSVDVASNTANAAFATSSNRHYALRIVPVGTFAGDVLVAAGGTVELWSSTGTLVKTYTLPGVALAFALNLDPNGTDFWTADINNGTVWEVNIATGTIDKTWSSGTRPGGLAVFGQLTAATGVPEPGTLSLLASGLVALGGFTKFRLRRA